MRTDGLRGEKDVSLSYSIDLSLYPYLYLFTYAYTCVLWGEESACFGRKGGKRGERRGTLRMANEYQRASKREAKNTKRGDLQRYRLDASGDTGCLA